MQAKDSVEAVADQPFPMNPLFKSLPVLSDEARERIYENVMTKGLPLKAVSARHGVDLRRVAAVVRLKELEKSWEKAVSFLFSVLRPYTAPPGFA